MRLFTGISIEPETLGNLKRLLDELRPLAPVKWAPPGNLHITTKFIGEWPEARLDELDRALGAIPAVGTVSITIAGLGFFRTALYAAVAPNPALLRVSTLTSEALSALGRAPETRPYSPHLTLARTANENIGELYHRTATMTHTEFGSFEARSFHLYLSKPAPGGSVYSTLRTYPIC